MNNYKANPISRNDIRYIVRIIRKKTGLLNTMYFPIIPFTELYLPQFFPDFELEIVSSDEMKNICGETKPFEHKIILNESIYVKAIQGDGFARLTVAHELGHLFLHDTNSISLYKLERGEALKPFEDPEWQADAFGGELLAPAYLIYNMSVNEISKQCGVSKRAAFVQKNKIRYTKAISGGGSMIVL